jgi:ABC-type spermidine/putrescine transport system permease subunit II
VAVYNRFLGMSPAGEGLMRADGLGADPAFYAILVYLFMFLPVAVVVLLSFNASQFGAFPMTGLSLRWFEALWNNDAVMRAFRTSLICWGC